MKTVYILNQNKKAQTTMLGAYSTLDNALAAAKIDNSFRDVAQNAIAATAQYHHIYQEAGDYCSYVIYHVNVD